MCVKLFEIQSDLWINAFAHSGYSRKSTKVSKFIVYSRSFARHLSINVGFFMVSTEGEVLDGRRE